MSRTLEKAFDEARTLPQDRQDRIGQWVRDFVEQERSALTLTAAQREEVRRRLAEPTPVYATDEQVAALLAKFPA
jgi:hypothetical protein